MKNFNQIVKRIESQISEVDQLHSFKDVKVSLTDDRSNLRMIKIVGIDGTVYRSANRLELSENLELSKNDVVTLKTYSAAIKVLEDLKKIIDCSDSKITVNYKYSEIEIKNETSHYWLDVYSDDEEDILIAVVCEMKQSDDVIKSVTTHSANRLVNLEEIEDVIKLIESKKGI